MKINTIRELLFWSYANLAMAHAAVSNKEEKYSRIHFIIRNRLYNGLKKGSMDIGQLADDERLKMILPQSCCYCGSKEHLTADHLIPRKKGGANTGDNLVWACRACIALNVPQMHWSGWQKDRNFRLYCYLDAILKWLSEFHVRKVLWIFRLVKHPRFHLRYQLFQRNFRNLKI
ncbi:HNH endonuclease [bacterium]|nr:HNH endonuclease [bacterium]